MRAMRLALTVMKPRSLAALACLLGAGAAEAGWQETRWHMSPRQVERAMEGAAPRSDGDPAEDSLRGKRIGNVGRYSLGGADFRVVYYYDRRGLVQVGLYPENRDTTDCDATIRALTELHGRPFSDAPEPGMRVIVWHDPRAGDRIRLVIFSNICDVAYERLRDFLLDDQAGRIRL